MARIIYAGGAAALPGIRKGQDARPKSPRRRGIVGLAALLFGIALFNVWMSGHYYRTGYAVSASLEEKRRLERDLDLLKTEVLTLRSPARIEAIAKGQLGLVDPKTERIIRLR